MSNSLAIAALTEALRVLLYNGINANSRVDPNSDPRLDGTDVISCPPDKVRANINGQQLKLNLYLYQTSINAAWRNQDMPRQVKPGETGRPPLPLNLYYLITAYGPEEDEVTTHRLLGRAMSILHDNPVLDPLLIQSVLEGNDLHQQFEHIRISPQPLTIDEISKLWTIFQTPYRISAAYLVTVVLIESTLAPRAPLPVTRLGAGGRGPLAFAGMWPLLTSLYGTWNLPVYPPPTVGSTTRLIRPAGDPPLARLGETLVLAGQNLLTEDTVAHLKHALNPRPFDLAVQPGDRAENLKVRLPAADTIVTPSIVQDWPCGTYQVSLESQINGVTAVSNEVPFMLAPIITLDVNSAPGGPLALAVTCRPRIRPEQEKQVYLLIGSNRLAPKTIDTPSGGPGDDLQPTTLTFDVDLSGANPGDLITVRLRVDGADSLPFAVDAQKGVLMFDPNQQITIT